jgi:hypothetical protein
MGVLQKRTLTGFVLKEKNWKKGKGICISFSAVLVKGKMADAKLAELQRRLNDLSEENQRLRSAPLRLECEQLKQANHLLQRQLGRAQQFISGTKV